MNEVNRTLLVCALVAVLGGALGAQQDPQRAEVRADVPEAEVVLRYFRPEEIHDLDELRSVAIRLFGPQIRVIQGNGDLALPERFLELDDTLIIRDSAEHAEEIVRTLREIERQLYPEEPEDPEEAEQVAHQIVAFEYVPRYGRITEGLERFYRELYLPAFDELDSGRVVHNIDIHRDGTIVIQETPEQLAVIREYLARVDVPVQQATFSFLVIRGLDATEASRAGSSGVPDELARNLRQLVPMEGFQLLSTGLLRASVRDPLRISTRSSEDVRFDLSLKPSAFDPASGELTLEKCAFVAQTRAPVPAGRPTQDAGWDEQSFETALSLRAGEYTVLGSVGPDPLFVVLKMTL